MYNDFKRKSHTDYMHYFCYDGKGERIEKIILGLPEEKSITVEERRLLGETPLVNLPQSYLEEFFKLKGENRDIINSILKKIYEPIEEFYSPFWRVLVDFIFAYYDATLPDIAQKIDFTDHKTIYNRLDKARKLKGKPRKDVLANIKEACAKYMISYDIVSTGRGVLYNFAEELHTEEFKNIVEHKYTVRAIRKLWEEKEDLDVKATIINITGIKENQLLEMPLQIAFGRKEMDKNLYRYLMITMHELQKRQ